MINVASIRAAARAAPGDVVGLTKAQLDELLGEVELGQRARRNRHFREGMDIALGTDRVSIAR